MDLKAISWVGNIYQKFETMCLEMEEVMYQDTVKYVENQVNIVGTSVKRFYSEVMQDVHPQCNIDPVKVAAADLSLNPYAHHEIDKKLKANLKGSTKGFSDELIDDTQVIKGKSKSGGVYKRQNVGMKEIARESLQAKKSDAVKLSASAEVRGGCEMASDHVTQTKALASVKESDSGEVAIKAIENDVPAAGTSINSMASAMTLPVESVGLKQAASRNSVSVGGFSPDSCDTYAKELACNERLAISSGFDTVEMTESCKERSGDLSSTMSKKDEIDESEVEIVEKFEESQLEETCVLVEGDGIYVAHGPVKQKSYKKKLREAFSTKKRLTRKEYEQLGALYEDQQQFKLEAEDKVIPVNSNSTKLSAANDHPESEWEIL